MKNRILKTKNSFSELEKDLKELKDKELKARGIKNGKEIEEQFFKSINVSIDDMEKFEEKMMKQGLFAKKTQYNWYDW